MTSISVLENIHKKGLFGDYEGKNENELVKIIERKDLLIEAINVLSPREKFIMIERRLKDKPKTLENLSNHYKISRERVRQIEVRAFEKLRKSVKNLLVKQNLDREDACDYLR